MVAKGAIAGRLVIDSLGGGRNGYDPPSALANNECVDAVNVEFWRSPLGRKRGGQSTISLTFSAGGPFANRMLLLARHAPVAGDLSSELWAIDASFMIGRRASGSATWTQPTLKDAITAFPIGGAYATVNSLLFLPYPSAVARMPVWDGATVRRAGLAATVAPTAADGGGGGAYAAVLRYYRQRSTRQSGGVTIGRSEPSASVSFTPSGANLNATVTQAAVINEGETHWEVEASIDNVTFYRIATVVIGTTTYADSAATTTYNTNPLSAATGIYTLLPAAKFVAGDQNRLLMFASNTSADKQSRVWYSAVAGSLDVGDVERLDTTTNYYSDLDEADSGVPTGLAGPMLGSYFAFKYKEVWRLTATGQPSLPFRADPITKNVGAVNQASIVIGEDTNGNPAMYWMSARGPYMWSAAGLRYIGRGVEDLILGPTSFMATDSTYQNMACYYNDKRQVWFWITTASSHVGVSPLYPNVVLVFDVLKNAWSRYPSENAPLDLASAIAVVMFPVNKSDLKPFVGNANTLANGLFQCDTGATDQGNTTYQGTVTTKYYEPGGPGYYAELHDAMLLADAASGVTISATVTPDFGAATAKPATALLTPVGSETLVDVRLQDSTLSGFKFYQYTLGDAAATTAAWSLNRLVVPFARHESAS